MMYLFSRLRRSIVCREKNEGMYPIGIVFDAVICPQKGKIEALWVKTKDGKRLLLPEDIREWENQNIIVVDSESRLQEPESLTALQTVFKTEVPLIGASVWNRNQYQGRVFDFLFDRYGFFIEKIWFRKGFWIFGKKRMIARSHVVKINEKGVFVSDTVFKKIQSTDIEAQEPLSSEAEAFKTDEQ